MHKETYSLVLNSQTSTSNITNNTNLSSVQYNINWLSILPQKYRRYFVTFQCQSANVQNVGFVGSQTANVLAVTNVFNGQLYVGMQYWIPNIIVTITSFVAGTTGGVGSYNINSANTVGTASLLYSTNTLFNSNVICSINFGSNNTVENNSSSNKLGTLYPYNYPIQGSNIYTSNLACTAHDNGPIEIFYPNNNNITVSFTNIDGTPVTRMAHYNLILYFEPIIEDINENIQNNNLLSGSY
jgi:hypothetical protein